MFSRALKPVFMARFSLGPVAQPAPVPPGMAIGRPVADIANIAHDAHRHRNAVERVDLVFASVIPEKDPSAALTHWDARAARFPGSAPKCVALTPFAAKIASRSSGSSVIIPPMQ